jgi:hypothetical protein
MKQSSPRAGKGQYGTKSRYATWFLLVALSIALITVPSVAEEIANASVNPDSTAPAVTQIEVYVVDFNNFNVATGTVEANFYSNLRSDIPVSINDFEIMNGQITSVDTVLDTPQMKEYRIVATVTVDPDLHRYPFDRHTLPIIIEPKLKNEQEMVLVINPASSGLGPDVDLPGWEFTGTRFLTTNQSYLTDERPYSRAVFNYGIERDVESTILKFFLPFVLIIIVSLFSLIIKAPSRLLLNASMFLGAILIHWYLTAAIPLVAYATFLDMFMIITYLTLVMVLLSRILILKFTESNETARVEQVYRWSIWIIPPLAVVLYGLLFLRFLG